MLQLIIVLIIGIILGVVFHTPIKTAVTNTWAKFRAWRKKSTRQP